MARMTVRMTARKTVPKNDKVSVPRRSSRHIVKAAGIAKEDSFNFMGLPPEVREMVYGHLYVDHVFPIPNVERAIFFREYWFLHLSCNLHLVSRLISSEVLAFVGRQPKVAATSIVLAKSYPEYFAAIITNYSRCFSCPAISGVLFRLDSSRNISARDVAKTLLVGIHTMCLLQPTIANLSIEIPTKQQLFGPPTSMSVNTPTLEVTTLEGPLAESIEPDLQEALAAFG